MTCKLTMALISEHQEGNCGDDWKYAVGVKVFHEGLKGEGEIAVPKHTLVPGPAERPHGLPEPLTVYTGECVTDPSQANGKTPIVVSQIMTPTKSIIPLDDQQIQEASETDFPGQ